jgi:hypothetical protein
LPIFWVLIGCNSHQEAKPGDGKDVGKPPGALSPPREGGGRKTPPPPPPPPLKK